MSSRNNSSNQSYQSTPTPYAPVPTDPILYQADWSNGLNGWTGGSDWQVSGGMLTNDGSIQDNIVSPYQPTPANYAIEAKIQVVGGQNTCFSLFLHADNSADGTKGSVCFGNARIEAGTDNIIASTPFSLDNNWHTYIVEVNGTTVDFFVDGKLILQQNDVTIWSTQAIGLGDFLCQMNISSFEVIQV